MISILIFLGIISTLCYNTKYNESEFSFGLSFHWVRILLISVLCYFASGYVKLKDFEKSIYLFIFISFLVISLGFFETLKFFPNIYQDIIKMYVPSTSLKNFEVINSLSIRRATSLLVHPSVYSLFVIYIFLLIYFKSFKYNLIKNTCLIMLIMCGLLSYSKIFYFFLLICPFYFIFKYKYKFTTYIYLILIMSAITLLTINYDIPKLLVFISEFKNKGLYESILRTRYDVNTGQLKNSYSFIQDNFLFGHGYMHEKKIFLGDSFILTNFQKFGLLGFSYLLILFAYLIKQTYKIKFPSIFPYISSMTKTNFCFLVLLIPVSIGFNVLSIFKLSDILFYFIFMTIFLSKRYNKKLFLKIL